MHRSRKRPDRGVSAKSFRLRPHLARAVQQPSNFPIAAPQGWITCRSWFRYERKATLWLERDLQATCTDVQQASVHGKTVLWRVHSERATFVEVKNRLQHIRGAGFDNLILRVQQVRRPN
jgi:hypothetical protein